MKFKKLIVFPLTAAFFLMMGTTAYAGGHGYGGHHMKAQAAALHYGNEHYKSHYSNQCLLYGHVSQNNAIPSANNYYPNGCPYYGHLH
ncbi:MAG: hypothetical protein LBV08_05495 [Clostridiales bacterium]|jgi:hypothetical protein|nr:hypothetical protein [Clostridiales bacterium]